MEYFPAGAGSAEIADRLAGPIPRRTLQNRLALLVQTGRLVTEGAGRATRYRLPRAKPEDTDETDSTPSSGRGEPTIPLSPAAIATQEYLRQPVETRRPAGYRREFLDAYRPNSSFYLTAEEREALATIGSPQISVELAGTYVKTILHRLLIDLSWNSSRLEGNTYSLLDTKRLLEFGQTAQGHDRREAQMIVNHKEAIEFLVGAAEEIGFNRYTILNLHGILADNLLPDEGAAGRLRRIPVGIDGSTFHPLEVPQLIEECFDQLLATAAAIEDPFEQALFVMVQLPYLQPFDDVNKRVSRLAANIPFIRKNLIPLSFTDVPRKLYTTATLAVYERNEIQLLKDVFLWAYKRSAGQYTAVRQSLGEPDAFRMKHSAALRQLVSEIVTRRMNRSTAVAHIAEWAEKNIAEEDREQFRETAESAILNLHEGNFARYQIRPSEFSAWKPAWDMGP